MALETILAKSIKKITKVKQKASTKFSMKYLVQDTQGLAN